MTIIAVAWNLVREVVRQRTTVLYVLLVAGTACFLPHALTGDDTLRGQFHLAVVYGLGLPCFLIALATVVLSAGAISREIESHTVHLLVSKSAPRWQIVVGKLLGVFVLDLGLLAVVFVAFAVNVSLFRSQAESSPEERTLVEQRFLSAKVSMPAEAHVDEELLESIVDERLAQPQGSHEQSRAEIEAATRRTLRMRRIEPTESAEFAFHGLKTGDSGETVFLRYELLASPPGVKPQVATRWQIASLTKLEQTAPTVPHELSFPAALITPEGELRVEVSNMEPSESGITLLIDPENIEVLSVYGRFWPNVLRAMVLVCAQLILLSSIALAGGSIFTFPTASLLGFFVYFTGLATSFLRETIELQLEASAPEGTTRLLEEMIAFGGRLVLTVVPDFARHDPLGRLASAQAITMSELALSVGWMAVVQGGIVVGVAAWVFWRSELAIGGKL